MLQVKAAAIATLIAFGSIQAYAEDGFKVSEFLTLSESEQEGYFATVMYAATTIATQVDEQMARCIADWYANDGVGWAQRNAEMLEIMRSYPDSHPTPIVVAVLQRECGNFGE